MPGQDDYDKALFAEKTLDPFGHIYYDLEVSIIPSQHVVLRPSVHLRCSRLSEPLDRPVKRLWLFRVP